MKNIIEKIIKNPIISYKCLNIIFAKIVRLKKHPPNSMIDLKSELDEKAQVGTIDKFQGQEAPITIISMTSSDAENLPRDKTFFFNRNRLNVAISRAQCLSIILFNPKLLETAPRDVVEIKLLNNFFKLMNFKTNI